MAEGLAASVMNAWLSGLASGGFYIKLHIGSPGAAGTSNPAANTSRQPASFTTPAGASMTTSADLTWTAVPSPETYSHWSAWTTNGGGTFVGSDALDLARSVLAGDTFVISAGQITIAIAPVAA